MLAAYHELKNVTLDTTELDVHLEQCASCRQVLARYTFIGEQVRSLPAIEPPADMHAKLMQALAVEHSQLIQQSSSAKPAPSPPAFLKPYLKEHLQQRGIPDSLAAFSTAVTGPLPKLWTPSKKRLTSPMGQFAVLGLVATLLMVLMMGGLTSLLLLAHGNPEKALTTASNNIVAPANVVRVPYTTNTVYQHVVSAVGDRTSIYYSAYADGPNSTWMLERLDRSTKMSIALLDTASTSPLIVLGSSKDWLVWLQLDLPTRSTHRTATHQGGNVLVRTWSLHTLSLATIQQPADFGRGESHILLSGTFDPSMAPNWAHVPIQGIWFIQDSLLVAMIDGDGNSHLLDYQLKASPIARTEIATASSNHILTSPTANSDGTQIYWSEEWLTEDGNLHSNIWTQRLVDAPVLLHRVWEKRTTTTKYVFHPDGISFEPQMVGDTLFFISAADLQTSSNSTQGTTATATSVSTPATNSSVTSRVDTTIFEPQIDASVHGNLFTLTPGSDATPPPTQVNTTGLASSLQAGSHFLLWQTDDGYGMLDVTTGNTMHYVTVGTAIDSARFLSVNGDTAVWTVSTDTSTDTSPPETPLLTTLMAFNWPK